MNPFKEILNENPVNNSPDESELPKAYTLEDELKKESIREKKIKNETSLGNIILKTLIQAMIESVGHSIRTNFVDLPRRDSPTIAATLEISNKERDLEKLLQEKIEVGIIAVESDIERLVDEGTFL